MLSCFQSEKVSTPDVRMRASSHQNYGTQLENDGDCHKPIPHKSSELHTTGEAVYVADIPKQSGQ